MQHHVYRTNISASFSLDERLFKGLSVLLGIILLTAILAPLNISPMAYLLAGIFGSISIAFIYRKRTGEKDLLIKIEDNGIEYFSEERDEMIRIEAESIIKVSTRFCELHILTKDNTPHCIDLSLIKTEQTRWEVKETVKQLVRN
jgi:hypothetical protein